MELTRKELFKRIGMAKGWLIKTKHPCVPCEDAYRNLLAQHGATEHDGRVSATTLATAKLQSVYNHLRSLGYQEPRAMQPHGHLKVRNNPQVRKVWALWFSVNNLGGVQDTSASALNAWLERQGCHVKINDLGLRENAAHADAAIASLKAWKERLWKESQK